MSNFSNGSLSYFDSDNETDVLVNLYNKVYQLSQSNKNMTIIFINLTGNYDTITINDLTKKIYSNSYSEYSDYSLSELEDQISLVYNDFYKPGIPWEPIVIIIHDAVKMIDCYDEYTLIDYLNDKLTLLKVLKTYIFCTIRND